MFAVAAVAVAAADTRDYRAKGRKACYMNIFDFAIVADFDGTITTYDSNDLLFYDLGTDESRMIEERFRAGEIGVRTTFELHFNSIPLNFEKYYQFIDEHTKIDSTFDSFYAQIREKGLLFYIVSGGFTPAIKRVLKDYNIPDANIFANDLVMEGHLKPKFAQSDSVCTEDLGPCGNCKKTCLKTIREQAGKKILFIGDGLTDRCAVKVSDYIFAKDSLIDYCKNMGLQYQPFNDFADISRALFD